MRFSNVRLLVKDFAKCFMREKEEKKKKKKEGPSWFEKTFNKISNEIFSDDDMK